MLVFVFGCVSNPPKPVTKIIKNIKESSLEEYTPSGNLIRSEKHLEDNSQEIPTYYAPPEPTFLEKVRNFFIKYMVVFLIILFLCPTAGMIIFKFALNRSRTVLTQVVKGVKDFTDKDDVGNKELLNELSRTMDKKSKDVVKRLK